MLGILPEFFCFLLFYCAHQTYYKDEKVSVHLDRDASFQLKQPTAIYHSFLTAT